MTEYTNEEEAVDGKKSEPSRECPKNTQFSSSRERAKEGKIMKKEEKKFRPDGNCNNITLDQTSTYIHILNDGLAVFFSR